VDENVNDEINQRPKVRTNESKKIIVTDSKKQSVIFFFMIYNFEDFEFYTAPL